MIENNPSTQLSEHAGQRKSLCRAETLGRLIYTKCGPSAEMGSSAAPCASVIDEHVRLYAFHTLFHPLHPAIPLFFALVVY